MTSNADTDTDVDDAETADAETRFLCDVMLGKLARYLRLCGYDAAYALDEGVEADDELLAWARREGRALLTRDATLAGRADDASLLESREIDAQLRELGTGDVDLSIADPPRRCGRCNGRLVAVPADESTPAYAPGAGDVDCWRCVDCGQYFWKGSHWEDVRERTENL